MIFHRLVARHLRYGDDEVFYRLQATDAAGWLTRSGVVLGDGVEVLDLGCGGGLIGCELAARGCTVTLADEFDCRLPACDCLPYIEVDINTDDLESLGKYDLVVCSNVYEHLARPERLLESIPLMLKPDGKFYLSWTNWLSPWGGHEFSPFHYLGKQWGHRVYDRLFARPRKHTPGVNLFPTTIGGTLARLGRMRGLRVLKTVPRYYPELAFITRIPLLREYLTWNCAMLIELTGPSTGPSASREKDKGE